eukprot:TRINITY_DN24686_c0_g1_i1.p1 TRINITY_DN24686_c0_g1~~TRINITY_DN24686_c0_g1_i1.p1  ORF type:complete len:513 (+),score=165.11 TRINITY_DN24686_c0_g1_i1:84-1622(+)
MDLPGLGEPNNHFISPRVLPQVPTWEEEHQERRRRTRDSRVRRQLRDDGQFSGKNIEHVWRMLKEHAPAVQNWELTTEGFLAFCAEQCVCSEYITGKLLRIFDKEDRGTINGLWLAKTLHVIINDAQNDAYVREAFDQYARGVDDDGISVDYIEGLSLPDPATAVSKKGKKKAPEDAERAGNVTYQMQEAMKGCLRNLAGGGKVLVGRQILITDFRRWWQNDAALVAAHAQQIFEVTASLYYGRDLPKLSKDFMRSLEPPNEDWKDRITFANTEVGMLVCMTPSGFGKATSANRYVGTVIGKTMDAITVHWRPPHEGGPPFVADTPGAKTYSKYDSIMSNLEDMMRSQWKSQHDIAPTLPMLQPGCMYVDRERSEPKDWWDGGGRPVRIIPFSSVKYHPQVPDDDNFMPDGRIVRMTPSGMSTDERYVCTIVARSDDAVLVHWMATEEGGPPAHIPRERMEPMDWWDGMGRPVRATGSYADHDSWLLRELERRGGVMPLDPKKGGKKGKKKK